MYDSTDFMHRGITHLYKSWISGCFAVFRLINMLNTKRITLLRKLIYNKDQTLYKYYFITELHFMAFGSSVLLSSKTDLDRQSEFWVSVMKQYDGFWHAHALSNTNMVKQRRLLILNWHIDYCNVGIVELVQNFKLPKIQSLKVYLAQISFQTANNKAPHAPSFVTPTRHMLSHSSHLPVTCSVIHHTYLSDAQSFITATCAT